MKWVREAAKKGLATKKKSSRGGWGVGGFKAIVAGPLKKNFCGYPSVSKCHQISFSDLLIIMGQKILVGSLILNNIE